MTEFEKKMIKEIRAKDTDCFKCVHGIKEVGVFCGLENSRTSITNECSFLCLDFKKKGK